jgi:hypothetical protein
MALISNERRRENVKKEEKISAMRLYRSRFLLGKETCSTKQAELGQERKRENLSPSAHSFSLVLTRLDPLLGFY